MSSLWTPGGERPIPRRQPEPGPAPAPEPGAPSGEEPPPADAAASLEQLRAQLAQAPAEVVIANHAFGLFELAAVHLSQQPPQLSQARLAIDAFAALVEGLEGRLGEAETQLRDGLAQLHLAFVEIRSAAESQPGS